MRDETGPIGESDHHVQIDETFLHEHKYGNDRETFLSALQYCRARNEFEFQNSIIADSGVI